MKNDEALKKAEDLAQLLILETRKHRRAEVSCGEFILGFKDLPFEAGAPYIKDIFLFGSVAEGKDNPNDIDMLVIDNGGFSGCLWEEDIEGEADDMYNLLEENISLLFELFFLDSNKLKEIQGNTKVDLHVLPIEFFTDSEFRWAVKEKHNDPEFFRNLFASAKRFRPEKKRFLPFTMKYLEKRYRTLSSKECDLSEFE